MLLSTWNGLQKLCDKLFWKTYKPKEKTLLFGGGGGEQKAENEQAAIIFYELITHLQIWQNTQRKLESLLALFSAGSKSVRNLSAKPVPMRFPASFMNEVSLD